MYIAPPVSPEAVAAAAAPAPGPHHGRRCGLREYHCAHLAFVVQQHEGELAGYYDLIVFDGSGTCRAMQTVHESCLGWMEA